MEFCHALFWLHSTAWQHLSSVGASPFSYLSENVASVPSDLTRSHLAGQLSCSPFCAVVLPERSLGLGQ